MPESIAGEVIGLFCGVAMAAPLFYQIRSQLQTPTKSPLVGYCWWLLAIAWLLIGWFFMFVPRAPAGKQIMDSPESPRTLGYSAFVVGILCQVTWALDQISPASTAPVKTKQLLKTLAIPTGVTILLTIVVRLIHSYIIRSRPFYRDLLAIIALSGSVAQIGASIIIPLELSESQLRDGPPEVAGLYWMPMAMQMLGLFTGVFTCALIYTNPEWIGVVVLSIAFAADALLIGAGFFKVWHRRRNHYGPVA